MSVSNAARFGMSALSAFSLPGQKPSSEPTRAPRPAPAMAFLAGIDATLDASGALWWKREKTLVVSDLHLETGSSYARSGQLLPPYDTARTLAGLSEVVAHYEPQRVILLGDSFHDPFGVERLSDESRHVLSSLCRDANVVWIAGNHDHRSADALGGTATEAVTIAGVTFRHIPTDGTVEGHEVAGHLHPAARITVRGRRLKRRAFVGTASRLVMPAFGCLTGGLCVSDPAFANLWPDAAPEIHMIGETQVYSFRP